MPWAQNGAQFKGAGGGAEINASLYPKAQGEGGDRNVPYLPYAKESISAQHTGAIQGGCH
jgi:hypothetical protein